MNIRQIRNATQIATYAGKKFLIDPWLADKGANPPVPFSSNQQNNPLGSLPISIDEIIRVDAVIITHLHPDHFDDVARDVLPKNIKMFAQNKEEAEELGRAGFQDVGVLREDGLFFGDIKITKTGGEHGRGERVMQYYKQLQVTGSACGVVFSHPDEKTLYIAGDTIWCAAVREAIETHAPDIIVVYGGGAQFLEGGPIIMGREDIYEVCKAAPQAKIIVSHMEAINHALLSRKELKRYIDEKGIASNVLIPADGEAYTF